ncbi:MAG: hypothetical protein Q8N88_00355 [Nanoarchaeota archaeon]|nr:hypothetical protein [Nanoarchaeota archaeon]
MNKILFWILILLLCLGVVFAGIVIYEFSGTTVKKPAIYLYPTQDFQISVKLIVNGQITKTVPEYKNIWNVFATKEGVIENKYDYLFYEAKLNKIKLPEEGWIIKYGDLESWLDTNLIKLGLNEKEKSQFKEYWLVELPKSNYYEIKLLENSFLNENMQLSINPKPDIVIRLNFYFKPIKEEKVLEEPIISTPQRNGFTVVEWGGILAE